MPATRFHGGLAGKERYLRARSRAARLSTQRWLEEYLEPEDIKRPRRPIPIRWRGSHPGAEAIEPAGDQSFAASGVTISSDLSDGMTPVASSVIVGTGEGTRAIEETRKDSTPMNDLSAPPEGQFNLPMSDYEPGVSQTKLESSEPKRPEGEYDIFGFVFGCCLGSAIAAVLLLALRFAIGSN